MRRYSPVRFTDVSVEGAVLARAARNRAHPHDPEPAPPARKHGILESLTIPQPPPPLRIPRSRHNFTTQIFWDSDIGKWIEAASYALSHRRDATIEAQIDEIIEWLAKAQLARRLPELLVHRPRDRQALDQPARQPRALLRRPHAGGRDRLLPGDRPAAAARHHERIRRPHRRPCSVRARTRSTAIAVTRRSSWRWSSSIT